LHQNQLNNYKDIVLTSLVTDHYRKYVSTQYSKGIETASQAEKLIDSLKQSNQTALGK